MAERANLRGLQCFSLLLFGLGNPGQENAQKVQGDQGQHNQTHVKRVWRGGDKSGQNPDPHHPNFHTANSCLAVTTPNLAMNAMISGVSKLTPTQNTRPVTKGRYSSTIHFCESSSG